MSKSSSTNPSALNRRKFLESSARNAATAAAGVVGLSGKSQSSTAAGRTLQSTPIRIGIIGARNQGLALARELVTLPECKITGLCDLDPQVLAKAARTVSLGEQGTIVTDEARHLIDSPEIDAVVIATPDHHHAWMTALAASAGKHVYLEIPVTHTSKEANELGRMLQAAPVVVQTGITHRSGVHYQRGIELVREGGIGKVRLAKSWTCVRRQPLPSKPRQQDASNTWTERQTQQWLGNAKQTSLAERDRHFHWRWFWDFGSGELGSWGVPLLDLARWGLDVETPEQVSAAGGCFHHQDGRDTPDTMTAQFQYADATIHWEHRQWSQRGIEDRPHGVAFYGDRGTLIMDRSGWKVYDTSKPLHSHGTASLKYHLQNFLVAIQTGSDVSAPYSVAATSSEMVHQANAAYRDQESTRC